MEAAPAVARPQNHPGETWHSPRRFAEALAVCTLLPFGADYRWPIGRGDTPWYPTMRLFRQPALFDWPSAIGAVHESLG